MEINRKFLEKFNPCKSRWNNYLNYYSSWSGSFSEFLELDKITTEDKFWVFFQDVPEWEKLQRRFAFECADRAVSRCDIPEVKELFNLAILIYESGDLDILDSEGYRSADWAADRSADWAAYRPADWAAYRAAYRAAHRAADWTAYRAGERDTQLGILKWLVDQDCELR